MPCQVMHTRIKQAQLRGGSDRQGVWLSVLTYGPRSRPWCVCGHVGQHIRVTQLVVSDAVQLHALMELRQHTGQPGTQQQRRHTTSCAEPAQLCLVCPATRTIPKLGYMHAERGMCCAWLTGLVWSRLRSSQKDTMHMCCSANTVTSRASAASSGPAAP